MSIEQTKKLQELEARVETLEQSRSFALREIGELIGRIAELEQRVASEASSKTLTLPENTATVKQTLKLRTTSDQNAQIGPALSPKRADG